jgi:hypothetical protein
VPKRKIAEISNPIMYFFRIQEAIKQREKEDAENPFSTKVDEDEFEEMEDFKK